VSGIGLIDPAKNADSYVPLGYSPELMVDAPAWVITTSGWISGLATPDSFEDATCIVVDGAWGTANWYVTGSTLHEGVVITPRPEIAPTLRLPPLAP
jgi:hypothetical protein